MLTLCRHSTDSILRYGKTGFKLDTIHATSSARTSDIFVEHFVSVAVAVASTLMELHVLVQSVGELLAVAPMRATVQAVNADLQLYLLLYEPRTGIVVQRTTFPSL